MTACTGTMREGEKVVQQFFTPGHFVVTFVLQERDMYCTTGITSPRNARVIGGERAEIEGFGITERKGPEVEWFLLLLRKFVKPETLLLARHQFAFWTCSFHVAKTLGCTLSLLVHITEGLGEFQDLGSFSILRLDSMATILPSEVFLGSVHRILTDYCHSGPLGQRFLADRIFQDNSRLHWTVMTTFRTHCTGTACRTVE